VLPIEIDREVGAEKRRRELSRQGRSKPKSQSELYAEMVREELPNARKLGLKNVTPEVRDALKIKAAIEAELERIEREQKRRDDVRTPEGERFKLTLRQKAAATLKGMQKAMPPGTFDYAYGKANLDAVTDERDLEAFLRTAREGAYGEVLEDWHRLANEAG
jgi:hypothetical protein